jgi:Ca2+-binding EF-hand superfamily protein
MGCGTSRAPVPDERTQQTIDMLKMNAKDLGVMWEKFSKYDKDKSGTIDIDEFYKLIGEKRSLFADSIFELIDLDQNNSLDFGEFIQTCGTFCMFGREDVRKFCYYIFDKDKNGYIEQDELTALIDLLHENDLEINCKSAIMKFDTNGDGKIDFGEFTVMDVSYPMLLYPAYRLQESMMEKTLGGKWWKRTQIKLMAERDKVARKEQDKNAAETARKDKLRNMEIKRRMGPLNYYLCFWKRDQERMKLIKKEEKRKLLKQQQADEKQKKKEELLAKREKKRKEKKSGRKKPEKKVKNNKDERGKRREKRRKKKK